MLYDPKTDAEPKHLLNGAVYSSATNSTSIDLSRHDYALMLVTFLSVGVAAATVQLQDSADDVSFADVSGESFFEPVNAATNDTRFSFVRAADVRRYIRLRITPGAGGNATASSTAIMLSSTQPPAATSYSIDTTP